MRSPYKIILTIIGLIIIICGTSYLTDKNEFNKWTVKSDDEISWATFYWSNDSIGDKYIERTAMFIPCKIHGLNNNFSFQFDLGSDWTVLYEKNINSVIENNKDLKNPIKKLRSPLQFWDKNKSFKDLTIELGNISFTTSDCFIYKNYGQRITVDVSDTLTTIPIGTIGADIFQNKVLIIDYPNQKFAVCNSIPSTFKVNLIDIELDNSGKVILPMVLNKNNYRISFDNGSSIFPIITLNKNISKFSTGSNIDTLRISSWGQFHNVTSKIISDTFELAGHKFSNVKVYSNHSGLGIDLNTDGTTGNALFWDKTIIIDFKNKKFGLQ